MEIEKVFIFSQKNYEKYKEKNGYKYVALAVARYLASKYEQLNLKEIRYHTFYLYDSLNKIARSTSHDLCYFETHYLSKVKKEVCTFYIYIHAYIETYFYIICFTIKIDW